MQCEEARERLHASIDGELSVAETRELDSHIAGCAQCRAEQVAYESLVDRVKTNAQYYQAPATLAQRIDASLPRPPQAPPMRAPKWNWQWLNAAAILTCAAAIAWSVGLYLTVPSTHERLSDEIVAAHVRSLLSSRVVDVASSDQHTVKPWFSGKIDFAPRVQDLTTEGFPLVGGRIDYVNHHAVAALVYRRRQHTITVFEMPDTNAPRVAATSTATRDGYRIVHWTREGIGYWAVSDVDPADLGKLQALLSAP